MTPQEWIEEAGKRWRWPHGEFGQIGAQHLAAALEEIARLQAQLAQVQAERVVVPELALDGMSTAAFVEGYRFAQSRAHSIPSSRVLKDGEVAVQSDEIELLRLLRNRAADSAPAGEIRMIAKDALRAQGKERP